MNASKLINWGELSRLLSGSRMTIRRNNIPKCHQPIISELLEGIEKTMSKVKIKAMNKITLELKHLAPYLPYEVNVLCRKQIYTLMPANFCAYNWNFDKLILHPLSDLTKEVEVNGERFVPKERLDQSCLTLFYPTERLTEIHGIMSAPYAIIINLHEWHFDVFGLIPKGLAVDINTL